MRFLDATATPSLLLFSPVLAEVMATRVRQTGEEAFLLRRQAPYLLLGPRDRSLPHLAGGLALATALGLPVYRRQGGGSLVYLGRGTLSFAAAFPCRDLSQGGRLLARATAPLRAALAAFGVEVAFGAAPGSVCEGPTDLLWQGRKLAGVALAIRGGVTLVGGFVLVDEDISYATTVVNRFYEAAGGRGRFRADALVRLADREPPVRLPTLAAAVRDALVAAREDAFAPDELRLAEDLLARRRLTVPDGVAYEHLL